MTREGITPAERMGISIGPTVVRLDWYSSVPIKEDSERGRIIERENRITVSAGDERWDSVPRHFSEQEGKAA